MVHRLTDAEVKAVLRFQAQLDGYFTYLHLDPYPDLMGTNNRIGGPAHRPVELLPWLHQGIAGVRSLDGLCWWVGHIERVATHHPSLREALRAEVWPRAVARFRQLQQALATTGYEWASVPES